MTTTTDSQFVKVTETDRVVRLTLARPPLNVLNIAMLSEINACLESLMTRDEVCALLINGEGRMFSSGVDVPEHTSDKVADMIETFHKTFRLMHKLPMPTVAAVHGGAYGGALELAMFCDMFLASDDAKLGVPEIKLGVFPPLAIAHLAGMVGVNKAAEMIYTGCVIDANEAKAIGLVNQVYPGASFASDVDAYMKSFSKLSAFSLRAAKKAFQQAVAPQFDKALRIAEDVYLKDLMGGEDPTEGLNAFMEKRKPTWIHR